MKTFNLKGEMGYKESGRRLDMRSIEVGEGEGEGEGVEIEERGAGLGRGGVGGLGTDGEGAPWAEEVDRDSEKI